MLLAIDIGNTNISLGVFRGKSLVKRFNIPTEKYAVNKLRKFLGRTFVKDSVVCSVVPSVTPLINADLKRMFKKKPLVLGLNLKVPIKNLYRNPAQVGQDRLVNAYAGAVLCGAPLIVVDFGTAVTFDVISVRGAYLGGLILPGLGISLNALSQQAALLPRIKLGRPKELIGRDTKSSMLSGIIYGFAALADDLIARIRRQVGSKARVVATGGHIKLISKYCKGINKIDDNLTLRGLNLIYNNLQK